ncbi:MAG: glycosyltransferase family 4 protein [Acidisphaera sp.]|nr:glycosyltransferase family 4 protein [Acidisphaera sp.]
MTRILIISHGHPDLGVGGGEIAAYRQCQELRALGHEVLFMGRAPTPSRRGGTVFSVCGADAGDVLFHSPDFDHFLFRQPAKWAVYKDFRSLLERFAPDVVHFHHYVHLGLELIREVRKYSVRVPILLTLHEYLAICHNHGQMVKTDGRLCDRAGPVDCHGCFPQHSPEDFFLREMFIKSYVGLVDAFVCPSRFLLERYAQWGLSRDKLHCIENGQPDAPAEAAAPPADILCRRFGFFGQLSELKGVPLLLQAVRDLAEDARARIEVDIHGTLTHQSEAFKERFAAETAAVADCVRYQGPYRPADLPALMRRVGWVVVPSVWWENSPLVIQEAFNHGRPVICGNIGGPAEKVADGVSGLHFIARNARDLAARMQTAADPGLWTRLRDGIRSPLSIRAATETHLALYQRLAESRAKLEPPPQPEPQSRPVPAGAGASAPAPLRKPLGRAAAARLALHS